ncbi:MAG: alpha/beta fold hydrolase, partial [Cyclobacteriaceae bacterium]
MIRKTYTYQNTWELESGDVLPGFQLAYHTAGELNESRTNVIWVCHALTANSNVSDWWKGLFGKGKALDPEKYFIICVNVPGSCYGSTNPLHLIEKTGKPYYHSFPQITIKDIVGSFDELRKSLGIAHIHTLIGGSLGGQQVLEWVVSRPELFSRIVPIATNARHSAWGIAYNETQRMAIAADPTWTNNHHNAGMEGMKTARAIALLSYRAYKTYGES